MTDPFNLSDFLPYKLAVLAERVSRRLAVEYDRLYGLTVAEWRVMVHVQRTGKASVRDIHDFANLDKARISRAVHRLEGDGLVKKCASEGDGRLVDITLTGKGRRALSEIIPAVTRVETGLLQALSDKEAQQLSDIIETLHAVLDDDPAARPRSKLD